MRSIFRVVEVSINTGAKILVDAGEACEAFHDETVSNVASKRVQSMKFGLSSMQCKRTALP